MTTSPAAGLAPPATASAAPTTQRRRATGARRPWVVAACRATGSRLARLLFRVDVTGAEHVPATGPVLLASNHSGLLDGPFVFLLAPRPAVLLTKSEVFVGVGARVFGWLGCIPVHRGQPDRAALQAGLAALTAGRALGVFPEGTRGTGSLEQVADGLAYLALRSGAPVVPIAVTGTSVALPRGTWRPRLRAPVRVAFGPVVPLDVAGDPRARSTVRATAEQVRLALISHVHATASP